MTHTSTQNQPASQAYPQLSPGRSARAHTVTHPQTCRGCDLHQPPWRCPGGLSGRMGELAVLPPSLPRPAPTPPHPPPSPCQLLEGVPFLGGALALCCDLSFPQAQVSPLWPVLGRLGDMGRGRGWSASERGEGEQECPGLWTGLEGRGAQTLCSSVSRQWQKGPEPTPARTLGL